MSDARVLWPAHDIAASAVQVPDHDQHANRNHRHRKSYEHFGPGDSANGGTTEQHKDESACSIFDRIADLDPALKFAGAL